MGSVISDVSNTLNKELARTTGVKEVTMDPSGEIRFVGNNGETLAGGEAPQAPGPTGPTNPDAPGGAPRTISVGSGVGIGGSAGKGNIPTNPTSGWTQETTDWLRNLTGQPATDPSGIIQPTPVQSGPTVTTMPIEQPSTGSIDSEKMRAERQADWLAGLARGKDLFKEGSLGRLNLDANPMLKAQRELAQASFNRQAQAQKRAMAAEQARAMLPAGSSFAQKAALDKQQMQAQGDLARTQTLDAYNQAKEQSLFNLGQANKELFGQYSTGITEQMLGSSERTGLQQSDIAKSMAEAIQRSAGGGGKGGK